MNNGMKFKEKELEDYIAANPQHAMSNILWPSNCRWKPPQPQTYTILGRQVKCSGGIIDLLVSVESKSNPPAICVLELKAVPAKRQDIEQVDRYVSSVKEAILSYGMETPSGPWVQELYRIWENSESWVWGALVAPGGCAETIVKKTESGFSFSMAKHKRPTYTNDELSFLISPIVDRNLDRQRQRDTWQNITRNYLKYSDTTAVLDGGE